MQKVFWTQGAKVSERSFAPVQPHFAPVQKQFWVVQKTFRRPLLPGSKRPFAPSPKHFWEFFPFRSISQARSFPRPEIFIQSWGWGLETSSCGIARFHFCTGKIAFSDPQPLRRVQWTRLIGHQRLRVGPRLSQAVLQGVPFMGLQVLR